jgi:tRNA-specific 2-thiouridylase
MSGGVDSSVAAALLLEQGYEVLGVTMKVYDSPDRASAGRCCSLQDVNDARAVAQKLGLPYYVVDFVEPFRQRVIDSFVAEYARGRTPIPCVQCNREIKFGTLLEKAERLRADFVATGHYARLEEHAGRRRLLTGTDATKDQSYFLFSLTPAQLERTLFPIGALTKAEVRVRAEALGLHLAHKPESQEICFVPDGDYGAFLERHSPGIAEPGPVVDSGGRTLGEHRGIVHYTVGQRRGLGLSAAHPLYVIAVEPLANTLVVGAAEELDASGLVAAQVNWLAEPVPEAGRRAQCRIRSTHRGAECMVMPAGEGRLEVRFDEPQRAVTPGQAAVLYDGEEVLGGGWIEEALREMQTAKCKMQNGATGGGS